MYMPHGVIMDQFWPGECGEFPVVAAAGSGIAAARARPVSADEGDLGRSDRSVQWRRRTRSNCPPGSRRRCRTPDKRNEINIAISADQIAANYVGAFTTLPSLELATMPQTWKENQEGLNEGYYSHCSFRSPTQAVPAEINPRNVLNRLFQKAGTEAGGGANRRQMNSLDRQHAGHGPGRRQGPAADIARRPTSRSWMNTWTAFARWNGALPPSNIARKRRLWRRPASRSSKRHASDSPPIEIKIPEGDKRSEYMQVMCDLNVLAFQTDTTRVSTYIGSTPNGVSYPELGFNDQHHSKTHHNNEPEKVSKVAAITAFNIAQFAYMVKKMHGLREGDGTLLDNCIMMWGSGLEDGNKHTRENLPFIIAGKGGGSINTGRFLPGHQGKSGRPAHHAARLCRHSAGPPHWDRNETTRGNQGLGINHLVHPIPRTGHARNIKLRVSRLPAANCIPKSRSGSFRAVLSDSLASRKELESGLLRHKAFPHESGGGGLKWQRLACRWKLLQRTKATESGIFSSKVRVCCRIRMTIVRGLRSFFWGLNSCATSLEISRCLSR